MNEKLTHFTEKGDAQMVDIAQKSVTHRIAIAKGCILMASETAEKIQQGEHKKGDVLGVARVAGIMAAKKTADLIPLCHPLPLTHISIDFELGNEGVTAIARAETMNKTGVEMEALTAVNVALLTVYDMCKAVDKGMSFEGIRLIEKTGGKEKFTTDG